MSNLVDRTPRIGPETRSDRLNVPRVEAAGSDLLSLTADPDAALQQAARVLKSPAFARAPRMRRFLAFVIDETLAGRSALLKEYTIAVSVFDKPGNFDQSACPIVRVEARRLRKLLSEYYAGDGLYDRLIIDIPRGSYVPMMRGSSMADTASHGHPILGQVVQIRGAERESAWGWSEDPRSSRQVTVMSCVLGDEGFLYRQAAFDNVIAYFSAFHRRCTAIAANHGGTVVALAKDKVTVYFGWPEPLPDGAERAFNASVEIVLALQSVACDSLSVRIGLATGPIASIVSSASPAMTGFDETVPPALAGKIPTLAAQSLLCTPPNGIAIAKATRKCLGETLDSVDAGWQGKTRAESSFLWRSRPARFIGPHALVSTVAPMYSP